MSESTTAPIPRRAVLAGAAWSVPVIAVAAMAPSAAASMNWRVTLSAGCLSGVIGPDPVASFTVTETRNADANLRHAFTETFSQEFGGTRVVFSASAAQEEADTLVREILVRWSSFRENDQLQGQSSAKIHRSAWPELTEADLRTEVRQYGSAYGAAVNLSASRAVSIDALSAGEQVGWGYAPTVLDGSVLTAGVPNVDKFRAALSAVFTENSNGGQGLAMLGRDGFSGC